MYSEISAMLIYAHGEARGHSSRGGVGFQREINITGRAFDKEIPLSSARRPVLRQHTGYSFWLKNPVSQFLQKRGWFQAENCAGLGRSRAFSYVLLYRLGLLDLSFPVISLYFTGPITETAWQAEQFKSVELANVRHPYPLRAETGCKLARSSMRPSFASYLRVTTDPNQLAELLGNTQVHGNMI
ncbi:hypothetical protein B0H16DRAFT_1456328 [Mycena metata]|uniref:Uncharacterized protein n=1 Tax=Mycena metata TaxID=1033252 RepID=A0AAD7JBA6_9AGAR|nr:hypothetical protein B0H16DRAFT_1456328 [Mycena metata]